MRKTATAAAARRPFVQQHNLHDASSCQQSPLLRLLGLTQKPFPLHSLQGCWICCTMPGPMGLIMTCTPEPWQVSHVSRLPLLLPEPAHLEQGSLRDRDSFLWASSSRWHSSSSSSSRRSATGLVMHHPAPAGAFLQPGHDT
jgi:hypothetical protein